MDLSGGWSIWPILADFGVLGGFGRSARTSKPIIGVIFGGHNLMCEK